MSPLKSLFGDEGDILHDTDFQSLMVASILPLLGIGILSPMLDSLIASYGTTTANIGLMISFFTAPAIVVIPFSGALADRYGRKRVLISSIVLFGAAGTLLAFTADFRLALFLRVLQGIGYGGINPVIITSIGDIYSGATETMGQGLRLSISNFSGSVFPILSGLLVVLAWQYPFLLYAIAIPIAVMVYLMLEEPTDGQDGSSVEDPNEFAYHRALSTLIRRRQVTAILLARASPPIVFIGFVTYNSFIVVRILDGTPPQAGLLLSLLSLVAAAIASQIGRITMSFRSQTRLLTGANVCMGSGFVIALLAPSLSAAILGVLITGIGFGIVLPQYRSIATTLPPDELRAGLVSIAEAGGRVMATLTPVIMGGTIAMLSPMLGFNWAMRLTGIGVAVFASGLGILCVYVIHSSDVAELPLPT